MRYPKTIAALIVLAIAGGAWVLVRSRINATALPGTAHDVPKLHRNLPPHGGTPIGLGDDAFNLELVRDPATGTLQAYVLDGEMEEFIRVADPKIDLRIDRDGRKEILTLKPVADRVTGETIGDTCLFQARAGWLKGTDPFKGVIQDLAIQDQKFKAVPFAFPEGSAKD
jgi:hypothetical protein